MFYLPFSMPFACIKCLIYDFVTVGGFDNFSSQYPAICKKQPPTLPCIQNCHSSPARNSMVKLLPATSVANTEREQDVREGRRPVEILPFLYLGCAEHSSCKSILEELNITAILNVTKNCPNYFEDSLDYKNIPIDDSLSADIQKWFDDAVSFIGKIMLILTFTSYIMIFAYSYIRTRHIFSRKLCLILINQCHGCTMDYLIYLIVNLLQILS